MSAQASDMAVGSFSTTIPFLAARKWMLLPGWRGRTLIPELLHRRLELRAGAGEIALRRILRPPPVQPAHQAASAAVRSSSRTARSRLIRALAAPKVVGISAMSVSVSAARERM